MIHDTSASKLSPQFNTSSKEMPSVGSKNCNSRKAPDNTKEGFVNKQQFLTPKGAKLFKVASVKDGINVGHLVIDEGNGRFDDLRMPARSNSGMLQVGRANLTLQKSSGTSTTQSLAQLIEEEQSLWLHKDASVL